MSHRRAVALTLAVALIGWGLDQGTKALALARLDPDHPPRFLGGLLTLQLIFNAGAAFSLGERFTIVFTLVSTVVLVVVVLGPLRRVAHPGWAVALGLLTAGILGNLTDRVLRPPAPLRGHVVDFLQLPHWAIFNVADMCVCSAAVLIMVLAVIKNVSLTGVRVVRTASPGSSRS